MQQGDFLIIRGLHHRIQSCGEMFFLNNKDAVIEILDSFIDGLADLKDSIKMENGNKLESLFTETRNKRNKILDSIKKLESE